MIFNSQRVVLVLLLTLLVLTNLKTNDNLKIKMFYCKYMYRIVLK